MAPDVLAKWLNTAGLVLGMAGVLIIFIWGPPQPYLDEGVPLTLDSGTVLQGGRKVADIEEDARRLKRRHEVMSRVGLGLVGLGFLTNLWRCGAKARSRWAGPEAVAPVTSGPIATRAVDADHGHGKLAERM